MAPLSSSLPSQSSRSSSSTALQGARSVTRGCSATRGTDRPPDHAKLPCGDQSQQRPTAVLEQSITPLESYRGSCDRLREAKHSLVDAFLHKFRAHARDHVVDDVAIHACHVSCSRCGHCGHRERPTRFYAGEFCAGQRELYMLIGGLFKETPGEGFQRPAWKMYGHVPSGSWHSALTRRDCRCAYEADHKQLPLTFRLSSESVNRVTSHFFSFSFSFVLPPTAMHPPACVSAKRTRCRATILILLSYRLRVLASPETSNSAQADGRNTLSVTAAMRRRSPRGGGIEEKRQFAGTAMLQCCSWRARRFGK